MTLLTFSIVLAAALLHASWNALIKVSGDRLAIMAVITASTSLLTLPFLFFLPLPDSASWPYLAASALIHAGYMLTLVKAYDYGDFSQIYPIARGSAPLLTTVLGFLLLKEQPESQELFGMALIVGGIMAFACERQPQKRGGLSMQGLGLSLAVGLFITSYSLVDGVGARLAGNGFSFALWTFFFDGFIVTTIAWLRRRHELKQTVKRVWRPGLAAAAISAFAYSMVVWAFTQSPIGLVATLRETSVLFAVLISVLFLRERLSPWRLLAGGAVVSGIFLIGLNAF